MDVIEKLFGVGAHADPEGLAVIEGTGSTERLTKRGAFLTRVRTLAGAIDKACTSNDRIAILLPPGAEAYAAEIAALFSGRTFCPFEPTNPTDRIAYCLDDLSPKLLITDKAGAERTQDLKIQTVLIDELDEAPLTSPQSGANAYIIYTSGSTGRPKGVCVSRRSMNKFLEWSWRFYDVQPGDRWAQFSSLGFDLSLIDLLTCLPCGGTLAPVTGLDRRLPARFIERQGIAIWHSVRDGARHSHLSCAEQEGQNTASRRA